jgi:hypothetical protein
MFEPQDHPDDIPYPGGAPRPPYDVTGYNIAYSMGITFDRILDGFDGPFEQLPDVVAPAARLTAAPRGGAYVIDARVNDAFIAVNRLLKARQPVSRAAGPLTSSGKTYPAGTFLVPASAETTAILEKVAAEKGLAVDATQAAPAGDHPPVTLKPVRIGLWDQYGGSMPSGWTRWLFEQFEFPFEVVYPQTLDAGDLNAKFDVLVFVDGAIPVRDGQQTQGGFGGQPPADSIPAEFRPTLGRVTVAKTVPELKKFVENGGTILTIGSSTSLGYHLGLPIKNALVEVANGAERPLPREKYFVPGSILEARIDNTNALAYGMGKTAMVFYDESPAFRLQPDAALKGLRPVAWYDSPTPLRSGWAWGQQYLDQAVSIVEAPVGKGHVVLYGNEVNWRDQPHGTFKLLFNGIYFGAAASTAAGARPTDQQR